MVSTSLYLITFHAHFLFALCKVPVLANIPSVPAACIEEIEILVLWSVFAVTRKISTASQRKDDTFDPYSSPEMLIAILVFFFYYFF